MRDRVPAVAVLHHVALELLDLPRGDLPHGGLPELGAKEVLRVLAAAVHRGGEDVASGLFHVYVVEDVAVDGRLAGDGAEELLVLPYLLVPPVDRGTSVAGPLVLEDEPVAQIPLHRAPPSTIEPLKRLSSAVVVRVVRGVLFAYCRRLYMLGAVVASCSQMSANAQLNSTICGSDVHCCLLTFIKGCTQGVKGSQVRILFTRPVKQQVRGLKLLTCFFFWLDSVTHPLHALARCPFIL